MAAKFAHLHTHTHYSLLDGMTKVPELMDRVAELGMDSIAITDHGVLYGAVEFYKEAKKRGIKPIIGMETYVAPRSHLDKTARVDSNPFHLILLAKNNAGYKNLIKLTSIAHLDGYYYKPRVDKELLRKYSEGIIALSACMSGEVGRNLINNNEEAAAVAAKEYEEIFGKDNFYIEIQDHPGDRETDELNSKLISFAKKLKMPLVVTRDSHYLNESDREVHDVLLCIQTGKTLGEPDRFKIDMDVWVTGQDEVIERFKHVPEAVANTVKIAAMCDVELELGKTYLPSFQTPDDTTPKEYLRKLCATGLAYRYGKAVAGTSLADVLKTIPKELITRLEYELGVIEKMGFESYFLIVQDFINWAKDRGVVVGPGRGSGAGSIVAYSLKITDIDPIRHNLMFERFLNPDRITMPDFDIDFQDDRRDEVIQYVTEKYGADHVAHIITFGSIMARNAIRDTGRALGMAYGDVDGIAKLVKPPRQGRHVPLKESVSDVAELKQMYDTDPQRKKLLDLAMRLEGVYRHASTHAAGVVISKGPLTDYLPIQKPTKSSNIANQTQYSMKPAEEVGLLKIDFLGLANLTILDNALKIIKKTRGEEIDLATLPLDDPKTFELLARADTMGVFQLESDGMRKYLKELKPTAFEDIVAMVSLYRPGPMQWIGEFIDRKNGRQEVSYLHPLMEPALKNTYGIIVYQEQVMQIAREMCGFTGPQADTLRYAMGKKIKELMLKMRGEFIEGAKKNGVEQKLAEEIFTALEDFSAYAFNKAHAAGYALIAYETAYLKAHYTAEFMAALLTSEYSDLDKVAIEVEECEKMGIKVLPPDVNESELNFFVVQHEGKSAIRFGLKAVKNIGEGIVAAVVEARETGGRFKSIDEFSRRIPARELNKKVLEAFIKCGAMDSLGERGQLLFNIDKIGEYASRIQRATSGGQTDIFGAMGVESGGHLRLDTAPELDKKEKLRYEKELIGLYISDHPLRSYSGFIANKAKPISSLLPSMDNQKVSVAGIITQVSKILTKKNDPMAFAKIEDLSGSTELVIFPKIYGEKEELIAEGKIILVSGKINTKDRLGKSTEEVKILADEIREITDEMAAKFEDVTAPDVLASDTIVSHPELVEGSESLPAGQLKIVFAGDKSELFRDIKSLLMDSQGDVPVLLSLISQGVRRTIKIPLKVDLSVNLVEKIKQLLGQDSVVIS